MANLLGYVASCAVLATFLVRTMVPLRLIAILSNVLFAAFGYVQHIYPVLFLHAVLLPINLWRLMEIQWLHLLTTESEHVSTAHSARPSCPRSGKGDFAERRQIPLIQQPLKVRFAQPTPRLRLLATRKFFALKCVEESEKRFGVRTRDYTTLLVSSSASTAPE